MRQHVSVTASGILSQQYLRWAYEVLGADRILFATDYPFAEIRPGEIASFFDAAPMSGVDRTKLASANWTRLSSDLRH